MQNMSDREAIHDILCLYTHAIDRRRWDIMARLFHPDAVFLFGEVAGDWQGFVEQAKAIIDPMPSTHHQLGNTIYHFDGNTAITETYCTAVHIIPADYPDGFPMKPTGKRYLCTVGLRYIDRFEKRNNEWRIASRNGVFDWRNDEDFNDGGVLDGPSEMLGKHDDTDPSTPITKKWRSL
ncbi:nuclear transport factor 2 family protein [Hellea sp.]|nr:nuclear transport factor 2 family protein [Hellea sp.]